jgi:hypothetical protein
MPVTLAGLDVPSPRPSGDELQIARGSRFSSIEEDDPRLNGSSRTVLSLTPGTKLHVSKSIPVGAAGRDLLARRGLRNRERGGALGRAAALSVRAAARREAR